MFSVSHLETITWANDRTIFKYPVTIAVASNIEHIIHNPQVK